LAVRSAAWIGQPSGRRYPGRYEFGGTALARARPVLTGVAILAGLQMLYGRRKIWDRRDTRPQFFDKLYGTDSVREALGSGEDALSIGRRWEQDMRAFNRTSKIRLLYPAG